MEGKNFFHVCTKGSDLSWMFKNDADFIGGVNRIGICVSKTDVSVIAFILMDNHVHFVLYGTMPMCKEFIRRYKQLTGRWIFEKYGLEGHIADVGTTIVAINSEDQLVEEIAYIDRNSIAAGYKYLPTQNPWGSARYMFNDISSSVGGNYCKISQLTDRERRVIISSRANLPSDWEVDPGGMINVKCFVDIKMVESLFKTPSRYIYFLSKKVEGNVDLRLSQGLKSFIPDKEMRKIVDDLAMVMFGVSNKTLLDMKSRILIAKRLRYEYGATQKQIARLLRVDLELLKGFV